MIYYLDVLNSGQIRICGTAPSTELCPEPTPETRRVFSEIFINPHENYCVGTSFIPIPKAPSEFHLFNYETKKWEPNYEDAWLAVRSRRDVLLNNCDFVILRANEMGTPVSQEWLDYRQALRDITEQPDPFNIVWPLLPTNNR